MGRPFPLELAPSHGDLDPSNTPESSIQTASGPVQSFFAGLATVTNRPTDHATRSVTIDCIYVRSTAMRPKNERHMLRHLEDREIATSRDRFDHLQEIWDDDEL